MRHDAHYVEEITFRGGIAIGRIIPIEEIEPNAGRPRKDAGDLQRLTDSVREKGVLNPLLVRFLPDSGKYGIISGQRRYQAARAAGLSELPCIEKDVDDAEAIEIALTENLQHKELTPSEEASWVHELAARLGTTDEEIARRVRKLPSSITSSSVDPHPEVAEATTPFIAGGNMDSANDAVYPTEAAVTPEQPASVETHSPTAGDAVAEASVTPERAAPEQSEGVAVPDGEPSGLDSELVCATERLLEEAKASILTTVRRIASGLEDELKGYLKESQQKMHDLLETGARELQMRLNEELAQQRDACIRGLVVQSDNVVRDAVSRVRTETEEIVRAGCASISNQLESTAVALRECEQQFEANTKAAAQEGVDAFRKQVNLLADEILGQSRQALVSVLDDLRNRMQKAASTLQL
jgi:ParB/RepB/Spo0J family partition protein